MTGFRAWRRAFRMKAKALLCTRHDEAEEETPLAVRRVANDTLLNGPYKNNDSSEVQRRPSGRSTANSRAYNEVQVLNHSKSSVSADVRKLGSKYFSRMLTRSTLQEVVWRHGMPQETDSLYQSKSRGAGAYAAPDLPTRFNPQTRALQPAIDKFKLAVRNGVHQENANEDEKIRDLRPEEVGTRRFPYRLSFAMPTDVSQSKCHDSNVFARGPAEKCPASLRSTSSQESIWSE
ncbi:hypothetical protein IWZ00DRAFT_493692 [Phyllosticta capitalensis]